MGGTAPDGTIRRLAPGDLRACVDLAVSRGWAPEYHKWELLFAIGDVYGIDDPGGGLAGTAVATRYGDGVAAISMVLVAEHRQRQGLGGRLMRHVMERTPVASFYLTATEYGRPLYERLGFRAIGQCITYQGIVDGVPRGDVSAPARPEDMQDVLALDTEVFGAERTALISEMPSFCERFHVVRDGTELAGFAGAWRSNDQLVVGPLIAQDEKTALALVEEMARPGPLRMEIDSRHTALVVWAGEHGMRPAFTTTIMECGAPMALDPTRLFLLVTLALG